MRGGGGGRARRSEARRRGCWVLGCVVLPGVKVVERVSLYYDHVSLVLALCVILYLSYSLWRQMVAAQLILTIVLARTCVVVIVIVVVVVIVVATP